MRLTTSHFLDLPRRRLLTKSPMRYRASRNASDCPMPPPTHTASSPFQNLYTPRPYKNTCLITHVVCKVVYRSAVSAHVWENLHVLKGNTADNRHSPKLLRNR